MLKINNLSFSYGEKEVLRDFSMEMQKGFGYYLLKIVNGICNLYLTVIRGTPVVVQLLIMYFVIFATSSETEIQEGVERPVHQIGRAGQKQR